MASMTELYSKAESEEGLKINLLDKKGEPSKFFARIRGEDSNAFTFALNTMRRNAIKPKDENKEEGEEAHDRQCFLIASVFISWDFDEPCDIDNVQMFIKNAPQNIGHINEKIQRKKYFLGQELENLLATQKQSSGSAKG